MSDEVQLIEMTEEEWNKATDLALEVLGLTYEQLAEQAKSWDFDSIAARKLWMVIKKS